MITISPEGGKIVPATEAENHQLFTDTTESIVDKKAQIENDCARNLALRNTYNVFPPLSGKMVITSNFGERFHPVLQTEILHAGIDLRANYEAVRSIANGIIVKEEYDSRAGNYIIIQHAGRIESIYCHLSKFLLRCGDLVYAGDMIAISGGTGAATGPHLHFAIKVNGKFIDPFPLLEAIIEYNKINFTSNFFK